MKTTFEMTDVRKMSLAKCISTVETVTECNVILTSDGCVISSVGGGRGPRADDELERLDSAEIQSAA